MMLSLSLLALLPGCKKDDGVDVDCDTYGIDVPSVRAELDGEYDPSLDRIVIFGGNDDVPVDCAFGATNFKADTWEYNLTCNAFKQLAPTTAPSPRGRYATATDGTKMYLHGGRFREGTSGDYDQLGDLWAYDYATDQWASLGSDGPSARSNHEMVVLDGKIWLFGGNTSASGGFFEPQGDLWSYDLASGVWTESTATGPQARLFHAMATDGQRVYVYGGGDEGAFLGPFLEDLWAYDPGTDAWTELTGGAVPEDRFWAGLSYNEDRNSLVMFGGHDNTNLGNTNQVHHYDLSASGWVSTVEGDVFNRAAAGFCDFPSDFVVVDSSSPERRNAGLTATTTDGKLVVFGGKTDCGLINDVWVYDPVALTWELRSAATSGESCVRSNASCESLCF